MTLKRREINLRPGPSFRKHFRWDLFVNVRFALSLSGAGPAVIPPAHWRSPPGLAGGRAHGADHAEFFVGVVGAGLGSDGVVQKGRSGGRAGAAGVLIVIGFQIAGFYHNGTYPPFGLMVVKTLSLRSAILCT